jgi:trigger factor
MQESLHNYLTEEKLEILGNPLPRNEESIDWDSDDFSFEFEIGLAPNLK